MSDQNILDARWYAAILNEGKKVDELAWFQKSVYIDEVEREQFFNNEIENPRFSIKYETSSHLLGDSLVISDLQNSLHREEKDSVVLDLYDKKLEKMKQRTQLLLAMIKGNDSEFYQISTKLYGKPKKKYFSYVAKQISILCKKEKERQPMAAKRLASLVSKIDQTFQDVNAGILPPLVKANKNVVAVEEVGAIFRATLERLEISDWTVNIDKGSTRSRFSVDSFRKIVYIPNQAQLLLRPKRLTDVQIAALAEHEIGVHARRAHEGEKSSLKLLQIGLDSYLAGEEGLAGYVQQQIEGADEFYGFDRYFAACLATGMDGTKRDFRAVFSVMVDYYILKYAAADNTDTVALRAAWEICLRIFRGTSGKTPGAIYTKDIVYMEGNIGIWHLISDKPHVFESLFLGKFNPLLSRHVKSLQTLGILKEW